MKQRITLQFAALLILLVSLPLAAKVSGLPDFTGLVEKAGPAVVNIRVTQFGTRSQRLLSKMADVVVNRVKTILRFPSFSDAILMYPMIRVLANLTVWGLAPVSYMLRMVIF